IAPRSSMVPAQSIRDTEGCSGFRNGGAEKGRRRFSPGAASLSDAVLLTCFFRRLLGWVLLLYLERSARCRHGGMDQGTRRIEAGEWRLFTANAAQSWRLG